MVIPVDFYNLSLNRDGATKTLNAVASDSDHIPCVLKIRGYRQSYAMGNGQPCELMCKTKEVNHTLNCLDQVPMVITYDL